MNTYTKRDTPAGNPIHLLETGEYALVGNDYYEEKDFGTFAIQCLSDGLWDSLSDGDRLATEAEAERSMQALIDDGWDANQLRVVEV